jgi:hypothetical protein
MSRNPIILVRAIGNVCLVLVFILAFATSILQSPGVWQGWQWSLLAVALIYAAASFTVHLMYPDKVAEAWDEQNTASHRMSLVFGYYATLAAYLALLALVWTDRMDADAAFFFLAPVLAMAPPFHYLGSILRGRAE